MIAHYNLRTNVNGQKIINTLRDQLNTVNLLTDNTKLHNQMIYQILEYTYKNLSIICRSCPSSQSKKLLKVINQKTVEFRGQLDKIQDSTLKSKLTRIIKRLERSSSMYLY